MQPTSLTVPSDANAFPPELLEAPQPVIGFVGLDCYRNHTHKSIWDAFNTNRKSDRAAIQFKLLTPTYDLPVVKPKRQSYEWYHPKGILKRNWILKHLHVLPAVIVVFQDLEWNDPQWTEKQIECMSMMQTIKNSTQGRHTKLAIVLLQKSTNSADDAVSGERLSTLAAKCDITQKMISILPYNDNLMGYTLRLESAFLEQAQSYYLQSSKQVRTHRDQLTQSHQELKIRHQFKLGFYAEMRMDLNTALKHFDQAYEWLEEIRIVDSNCLEIKVVASFLNYKICKLMFNIGSPREAITQFRAHIDKYRNRIGFKELLFEHFAWLSVQYNAFADLFCDAIKLGLPALQTQHPGIYYHKSAEYMSKRKDTFQQSCQASSPLIDFLPLSDQNTMNYSNILYSDFFGVRGGNRSTEPVNDQQIIAIVQECEKNFNNSIAYISLLGQAMAQFKIYRCPRFRKKLAIDMAEEYLKMGDSSKALTLYSLMLSEYRIEKWNNIFTQVLLKTLRSAFLSASVPDFIICSIETLSEKIVIKRADRIIILENLWKVFQKVPPIAQSQIVPELHMNWEKALNTFNTELVIDLDKITKVFDCTVKFEKNQILHNEVARVNLFIRSVSDVPIKVREVAIIISNSKLRYKILAHQWLEFNEEQPELNSVEYDCKSDLMILPNKLYKISFIGEYCKFSENSSLSVFRLEIKIGTNDCFVTLLQSSSLNMKTNFNNCENDKLQKTSNSATCYIIPIFHLKTETLLSYPTMLTNEYFGITIEMKNEFDMVLENVTFSLTIPAQYRNKVFIVSDLSKSRQKLLSQFEVVIGNLASKVNKTIHLKIFSLIEGTLEFEQLVRYQIANDRENFHTECTQNETNTKSNTVCIQNTSHNVTLEYIDDTIVKSKKDTIYIPCSAEFVFTGRFFSLNKEPLKKAIKYEDFLFQIELEIKSTDIEILDIFLISDYNITEKPHYKSKRKYNKIYTKGDKVYDVRLLFAEQTSREWIDRKEYQQRKIQKPLRKIQLNKSAENIEAKISFPDAFHELSSANLKNPIIMDSQLNNGDDTKIQSIAVNSIHNGSFIGQEFEGDSTKAENYVHETKSIYNHTVDAFTMINNQKGFLCAKSINLHNIATTKQNNQIFGVYCIRWRRVGEIFENETKIMVNSIEIVEAPLNLNCYLDEKMYVKVPMTLTITLKNTTNSTIHLKSHLKNADNFMFAGHSQFNVSLFAQSTYNLEFNLYPLKAGWQNLPEFILKYNTKEDIPGKRQDDQLNLELQSLVERWMPKKVFILPMVKQV